MPIKEYTRGRRIRVTPNSLVGPFGEGTVLSEEYLSVVHKADLDHILRNGGAVEVSQDTPLTSIPGADLAPLIARAYPAAGGVREPTYLNNDGSPAKMVEVKTPHSPAPIVGKVPEVEQTEAQRLASQPNFTAAVPPQTEEQLHKNDEPPIEPNPVGGAVDKMFPAPGQEPPPRELPKVAEPVDLEEKPGTGTAMVVEDQSEENAHRPARDRRSSK